MSDAVIYLLTIAAVLFLRMFVLSLARVKGSSMLSTLENGDWMLVWRLGYWLHPPKRQDVVICRYPGRYWRNIRLLPMSFVKRVIGLPGETYEVVEGMTHIDGQPLPEPYLDPRRVRFYRSRPPKCIGKGEFFVLGDHRDSSNDSRSVGPLKRRAIRGRVVAVVWPPRRMKFVK